MTTFEGAIKGKHIVWCGNRSWWLALNPAARQVGRTSMLFVIVRAIVGEKPLQMSLVQRDYVVEQVSSPAPDPALRHSILQRLSIDVCTGAFFSDRIALGTSKPYFGVVVEQQELGDRIVREGLSQLLGDPTARGMPTYIEVQDAPTVVSLGSVGTMRSNCTRTLRCMRISPCMPDSVVRSSLVVFTPGSIVYSLRKH